MASYSREASPSPAVPGAAELAAAGVVILLTTLVAHWNVFTWFALPYEEFFDFYLRIVEYERELAAGFWPQNLPDAVRGAGHAFPRFYPPFAYAVAVMVNAVVDDVIITTHVTVLLPFLIGGLLTYFTVRRTGGTRAGAMLGALVLVTWPYLGIALHPRGAFAELWTLPWYPVLALAVMRTREHGSPPWWLPLPLAGLCVSHAVMSLWTLPVVVLAAFIAASGAPARTRVVRLTLVGAALTAFFTLPMTWYRTTVRVADPVLIWATPERLAQHTQLLTLPPVWV
ncbi:MAG TPA: 6-pyruvoyl-tetrahydropterin synthase-related protein, partial [Gemmatimonadales bacterium]|nr:6-pyruvoyl-tetrahydropterin synthase-related protein [Gemmatimonadales bacterium]